MAQKQLLYSKYHAAVAIGGLHNPFHAANLGPETSPPPCSLLRTTTSSMSSFLKPRKRQIECMDRNLPHRRPPGEFDRTFSGQESVKTLFAKSNRVEVQRPPSCLSSAGFGPRGGAFYPATVVSPPTRSRSEILVEYPTVVSPSSRKHPQEYVDRRLVRPVPPPLRESVGSFEVDDSVDAYYENAWQKGIVVDVCRVSRYTVFLEDKREEFEFAPFNLRLRREWVDGRWVPPRSDDEFSQNKHSDMEELSPLKKLKLKITFGKKKEPVPPPIFKLGQTVEVTSDQVGFEGSWYTALITSSLGNEKYVVEYRTLLADDETGPLHEETSSSYIRSFPPQLPEADFKRLDQVDAWYNDGWWEGVISKVLEGQKYVVYFRKSQEELMFPKSKLRIHQDWIDGKWVIASKDRSNSGVESGNHENNSIGIYDISSSNLHFEKGMKVEIRSDKDRYGDYWLTAEIIDSVGNGIYLVEYQTLRNNDVSVFLIEGVATRDIRSCPPDIKQIYPFALLEAVDAWYNHGWWTGYISQVLDGWNYRVYFRSTHEEMVFNHCQLRLHRDWIRGQWVNASKVIMD